MSKYFSVAATIVATIITACAPVDPVAPVIDLDPLSQQETDKLFLIAIETSGLATFTQLAAADMPNSGAASYTGFTYIAPQDEITNTSFTALVGEITLDVDFAASSVTGEVARVVEAVGTKTASGLEFAVGDAMSGTLDVSNGTIVDAGFSVLIMEGDLTDTDDITQALLLSAAGKFNNIGGVGADFITIGASGTSKTDGVSTIVISESFLSVD